MNANKLEDKEGAVLCRRGMRKHSLVDRTNFNGCEKSRIKMGIPQKAYK